MGRKPAAAAPQAAKKAKGKKKAAEEKPKRKEPLTTAEWRKIRMEYIKGRTTYAKLAEKEEET